MMSDVFFIRVPASTANLGPGFDSIGLALNLYLTLEVENSECWEITSNTPELIGMPMDESHFIYQVANQVSQSYEVTMPPCKVKIDSSIPLARGLGSSAAAIVAGIELADQLCGLKLSRQEKLRIATKIEGHPDNVGASLFGGLVVGSSLVSEVQMLSFSNLPFEVVAIIPQETLLTKESRHVLPNEIPFNLAVEASSLANVLVASLLSENWTLAGIMMEKDLFHQPYRKKLIPHYEQLEQACKENGAFGVALSGGGPTVMAFVEKGLGQKLQEKLQGIFTELDILLLSIDQDGSSIKKSDSVR